MSNELWPTPGMTDRARVVISYRITPGMRVLCRTYDDRWLEKTAASPVLAGYKNRQTVLVYDLDQDPYGWPAEDVKPVAQRGDSAASHPEDYCHRCGAHNPVWHAPNDLWNRVMGGEDGIVCPSCFAARAEDQGDVGAVVWRFAPEPEPPSAQP